MDAVDHAGCSRPCRPASPRTMFNTSRCRSAKNDLPSAGFAEVQAGRMERLNPEDDSVGFFSFDRVIGSSLHRLRSGRWICVRADSCTVEILRYRESMAAR